MARGLAKLEGELTRVGSWAKTWAPEITDIRAQFCHIHHGSHLFVIGAQNTNLLPFCKYELEISFPLVLFVDQITNIQFFVRAFNFWYIGIFMGKVGAVLTCPHRSNTILFHVPTIQMYLISFSLGEVLSPIVQFPSSSTSNPNYTSSIICDPIQVSQIPLVTPSPGPNVLLIQSLALSISPCSTPSH